MENAVLPDVEDEEQPKEVGFFGCIPNFIDPRVFTSGSSQYDPRWIEEQTRDPSVLGTSYGCHPHYADQFKDTKEVFFTQLTIAKEYQLPIIIHCRSGHRGTLDAEASCMEVLNKAVG
ncbi:hypothetical protein TELCIR_02521 [Teladorsagia circumcincta]|uniref:Hydrolase, TatD family n=1 Tax=Teladorsagia circumcincta TaxID=45464 RepID=A0A2G9UZ72_TELCI|nr:hypothetical protein TELCIR_02521 [Teladorsagia circumcincta]